jgi:hypothetical protein
MPSCRCCRRSARLAAAHGDSPTAPTPLGRQDPNQQQAQQQQQQAQQQQQQQQQQGLLVTPVSQDGAAMDMQENTPAAAGQGGLKQPGAQQQHGQQQALQQQQQQQGDGVLWQQQQPRPPPPPLALEHADQLLSILLPLRLAHHFLSQYKGRCVCARASMCLCGWVGGGFGTFTRTTSSGQLHDKRRRACTHIRTHMRARRDALWALAALPPSQAASAGALLLRGRCLYELVDYAGAADAFGAAHAADPLSMEVRARVWAGECACLAGCAWGCGVLRTLLG